MPISEMNYDRFAAEDFENVDGPIIQDPAMAQAFENFKRYGTTNNPVGLGAPGGVGDTLTDPVSLAMILAGLVGGKLALGGRGKAAAKGALEAVKKTATKANLGRAAGALKATGTAAGKGTLSTLKALQWPFLGLFGARAMGVGDWFDEKKHPDIARTLGSTKQSNADALEQAKAVHELEKTWKDEEYKKLKADEEARYDRQLKENRANAALQMAVQQHQTQTQAGLEMINRYNAIKQQEVQSLTEILGL